MRCTNMPLAQEVDGVIPHPFHSMPYTRAQTSFCLFARFSQSSYRVGAAG